MEEKEKLILKFMEEKSYVPMKAKEMATFLQVPEEQKEIFKEILLKLEKEYKIKRTKKNRYELLKSNIIQGIFRANEKGYGFVVNELDALQEIYIAKENTKNSLNGDRVLVEITQEKNKDFNAEGRIIEILKHEKNTIVGTFVDNRNFGFVVPDDRKLGTDIFISKNGFKGAKTNQKVVVKITKYPEHGRNAEGKIIEILGDINEAGVDMLSLIKEYDLPYEFPNFVLKEAEDISLEVSKKDIPNRVDLRKQTIFTIDGEDAKDLDDAVSVEKLENGNYKLDVHIADVSYYVKENSKLDEEALKRGTSVYMLDRVIPMLPKRLSNGICSLNEGEDRFTLSVSMEIDNTGNVISSDVYKAIICVTRRMSYTNVQKILDNSDEEVINKYKKYIQNFKQMEELAKILQQKRKKQGSLDLDIPESKITLDENGVAISVGKYELSFANTIIEQFMLTANETIAEKFFWLQAPFIYRVHEIPDIDKIKELDKFLYNFGYRIKGNKENVHPKAFAEILEKIKGKEEEMVVSNLILRTLKIARYEAENKGHFGIASKYYCHFTSPIRRYPDLFIHRIISKYLENQYRIKEEELEKYYELAQKDAKQSSEREKVAQKVERDSIDIKKAEYMQDKIGEVYEGIISSVTSFGLFVELENTIEGIIRFENLGNEYFIYNDEHKYLIGEKTNKTYKIGDKIKVRLIEANKNLRKISFEKYED